MTLSPNSHEHRAYAAALFTLLCLVWGSSWIALKAGVSAVPPLAFAGSRFFAAGVALLAWLAASGSLRALARTPLRWVLPGAVLMIAVNYGLMAWGVMRVTSGVAAVVNLTTVPLAMTGFAALYGRTRWTWRAGLGTAFGSCGLAVLFSPTLSAMAADRVGDGLGVALGLAAIVAGAACYAWGSILTQRCVAKVPPLALSTLQALIGGGVLLAFSGVVEPWSGIPAAFATLSRVGGWLFLVAVSVASTPAYLALLARWEPTRVAAYAYICPPIAVLEGLAFAGETISGIEAGGALLLGLGAFLVLRPGRAGRTRGPSPAVAVRSPEPGGFR